MTLTPLHPQTLVWLHLADAPRDAAPYQAHPDVGLVPMRATRTDLAAAKAELERLERKLARAPGADAPPEGLVDRLVNTGVPMGDRLLAEALRADVGATADAAESVLLAVSFRAPERAARIAHHYGASGDVRVLSHLILLATSDAWQARRGAIDALGALGDPGATDSLAQAVLTDPEPFNAMNAALALGKVARHPFDTARVALEHARDHAPSMVQRAATEALARLGLGPST